MNYFALKKFVLKELEDKLPEDLYYHNIGHTFDVLKAVENIASQYELNTEDFLLLQTAALTHETGMMLNRIGHEEAAVTYVKVLLPEYGYNNDQINRIGSMILATKMPQNPKNLLEEILCDADLDYLGREDYHIISHKLRLEWIHFEDYTDSLTFWYNEQIRFLQHHQYFTSVARAARQIHKEKILDQIKLLLSNTDSASKNGKLP
jgi:predicted metal-dependent HD superfamily phosphohydrolase